MGVAHDLQLGSDLLVGQEPLAQPGVPHVDPQIAVGAGKTVSAATIVMGLAQELNNDKIELPGFPDVVARLQRALTDERTSAKDIVKLVASEPTLAARLVQLANSAAFNKSGREVSDLRAAISSLGFNLVRAQATAFAMRQMEQQEWLQPIRPYLAETWKTSNAVASLSFVVARQVSGVAPDESLAAGLFHLIGKLYVVARARQESINPEEIADWSQALDDWHTTIARSILDHWKIPQRVAEAVERQDAIFDSDNKELAPLTRVLCAAKLHYRLRRSGAAPDPEAEEVMAKIRFDGRPAAEVIKAAQAEMEAMRAALA